MSKEFLAERDRFDFRFQCEDCAFFAPDSGRCRHGWPNEAHRAESISSSQNVEFCKQFELA